MEKKKVSLVLEGGGMRGAYTAGCLSWLIDEGLEFDCAYGISTGALHLCSYLTGKKEFLYEISTNYICDKSAIGLRSFFREGKIVSYDYLFDNVLVNAIGFRVSDVAKCGKKAKIGLYDLEEGGNIYRDISQVNNDCLKAACSLPILAKVVWIDGKPYLDGGISKMIPIEQAIEDGYERHLVIATKPAGFVRKKSKGFVNWLMGVFYPKWPSVKADYSVRHLNYNAQVDLIKKLASEDKACYMFPSKESKVTRLSSDKEELRKLYQLGRDDMENRRNEIYALFK